MRRVAWFWVRVQMRRFHLTEKRQTKILTFIVQVCAVLAVSDIVPSYVRVIAAALGAGCAGVLGLSRPTNPAPPSGGK